MPTPTSINTNNNGVGGAGMNYETTEYIRNGNNNYTGIIMSSSAANANSTNPTTEMNAGFLRASRAGNLEKVLEYLNENIDINISNSNGLNALHLASKEGHVNVVRELLERNAFVDAATKKGNTALHIASLAGQQAVVELLVKYSANVDCRSQNGFTPLYMAAQENHIEVVKFLLANNANQSLATEDGFTPLAVALQQGHEQVVAILLENDSKGKIRLPALHIAAKKNDVKAAALLLNNDPNMDLSPEGGKSGFTPLHIAAHYGNIEIAKFLISKGADVNFEARQNITPLHVATKWGKSNSVNLLLDNGAKIDVKTRDGLTPLHCAARSGHDQIVELLFSRNAPINAKTKNGLTALHMAAQGDHVEAARILLYHSPKLVDQTTCDFLTALHVAAHCGHVKIAKLLLDHKADVNARALNGFTPLHIACKKNRIKVIELLIKHGASKEATTESGLTPLHVASFMGCMSVVVFLIQHGSQPNVPTIRGETPLHLAARANQTDIVRILLRHGANVDAKAKEQQTPLHIATRLGNTDIIALLLRHGAFVDAATSDGYTALHIASKEGQEEVASILFENGASLNVTTKKGFTPLHIASKYGNIKVASLLLQRKAQPDIQGKNGLTPLHVATHYNRPSVAHLLLQHGASPHIVAKNGYSALHIAAKKNQIDIATTLLEYQAKTNCESNAGFTPLHLACQEGHLDMACLLLEHSADAGAASKNGLTPLHLCAQEDKVNCASVLVKSGAIIDPQTKAGYTPLHVACHFGQINMVRFLLSHMADVNIVTRHGFTSLHCSAQQGHVPIVKLLLESGASPDITNNNGQTPLAIAQRLGYLSVIEELKLVTQTTLVSTTIKTTEEKYKVQTPETMQETFMSDSEDELGDDAMFGDAEHYKYLTNEADLNNAADDSIALTPKTPKKEEAKLIAASPLTPGETQEIKQEIPEIKEEPQIVITEQIQPQPNKTGTSSVGNMSMAESMDGSFYGAYESKNVNLHEADNIPVEARPKTAGFLISFMVDARGGAMKGCRHSGVRVIIPPRRASMPTRITCRFVRKEKLACSPPLNESESLAARVLEMGPHGCKFLGPVVLEIPHYASLRGKEREIMILRNDTGEKWYEHPIVTTDTALEEALGCTLDLGAHDDGQSNANNEDTISTTSSKMRITRIITNDFPKYFALVSRIRHETHAVSEVGGVISSTIIPRAQAVFPEKALQKKIKLSLQAMPIPYELVAKMFGNRVAVSPIVTIEPRRRKFHKAITLTIPLPKSPLKGMINTYAHNNDSYSLRLLCSITGGLAPAQWEDITGHTPLSYVDECVSFTTTVSARFWLMDCQNVSEATKMATELYREAIAVPFMSRFIVYAKRYDLNESKLRVYCITDDKEEKLLEMRENFITVAKSKEVEVLENRVQYLEMGGNIAPITKSSGEQLSFNFMAFYENRLPFSVRIKDIEQSPAFGRLVFLKDPKNAPLKSDVRSPPVCTLDIQLPPFNKEAIEYDENKKRATIERGLKFALLTGSESGLSSAMGRSTNLLYNQANENRVEFNLRLLANDLNNSDKPFEWIHLAHKLELTSEEIDLIRHSSSASPNLLSSSPANQTYDMLVYWHNKYHKEYDYELNSNVQSSGEVLLKALKELNIDEEIINKNIIFSSSNNINVSSNVASTSLSVQNVENILSVEKSFAKLNIQNDKAINVPFEDRDIMKDSESVAEQSDSSETKLDRMNEPEMINPDLAPATNTTIFEIVEEINNQQLDDKTQSKIVKTTIVSEEVLTSGQLSDGAEPDIILSQTLVNTVIKTSTNGHSTNGHHHEDDEEDAFKTNTTTSHTKTNLTDSLAFNDYCNLVNKEYETIKQSVLNKNKDLTNKLHHDFTHEDQVKLQRELDEQFKHINESVNKTSSMNTNQQFNSNRTSKLISVDQQVLKDQLADFINHIDKKTLACDSLTFVPDLDAAANIKSTSTRSRTSTSSESRSRSGNRARLNDKTSVNVNKIFISQNTKTIISDTKLDTTNVRFISGNNLTGSKIDGSIVLSDDETIEETIDLNKLSNTKTTESKVQEQQTFTSELRSADEEIACNTTTTTTTSTTIKPSDDYNLNKDLEINNQLLTSSKYDKNKLVLELKKNDYLNEDDVCGDGGDEEHLFETDYYYKIDQDDLNVVDEASSSSKAVLETIEHNSPILERELLTTEHEIENIKSRLAMSETVTAVTKSVLDSIRNEYNLPAKDDDELENEQIHEETDVQQTYEEDVQIHSSSNEEYTDYRIEKENLINILEQEDLKSIDKIMMVHTMDDKEVEQIENDEEIDDKDLEKSLFHSSSAAENDDFKETLLSDKAENFSTTRKLSISQTLLIENSESDSNLETTTTTNKSILKEEESTSQIINALTKTTQYQTFESSSSTNSDLYKQDDFDKSSRLNKKDLTKDDDDDSNDDDDYNDSKPSSRIKKRTKQTSHEIIEIDDAKKIEINYSSGEVSSKSFDEIVTKQEIITRPEIIEEKKEEKTTSYLGVARPSITGSESREFLLQEEDNDEEIEIKQTQIVEISKLDSDLSSSDDKTKPDITIEQQTIETVNLIYSSDSESENNLVSSDLILNISQLKPHEAQYTNLSNSNEEVRIAESTDCSNCSLVDSNENLLRQSQINLIEEDESKKCISSSIESVNDETTDANDVKSISKSLNYLASLVVTSNSSNLDEIRNKEDLELELTKCIEDVIEDKADLVIKGSKSLNFSQRPMSFKTKDNENDFIATYEAHHSKLEQFDQQTPTPVENIAGDFFDKRITSSNEPSIDFLTNLASNTVKDDISTSQSSQSFDKINNQDSDKEVAAAVATALLFSSTVQSQSADEMVKSDNEMSKIDSSDDVKPALSSDDDKLPKESSSLTIIQPRAYTKYIVVSKSTEEKEISSFESDDAKVSELKAEGIDNPCFVDSTEETAKIEKSDMSSSSESMIINQDYDDTEDQLRMKEKISETLKKDDQVNLIQEEEDSEGVVINTLQENLIDEQTFLISTPTPSTQSPLVERNLNEFNDQTKIIASELVQSTFTKTIQIISNEEEEKILTPRNSPDSKNEPSSKPEENLNVFEEALSMISNSASLEKNDLFELKSEAQILVDVVLEKSINKLEEELHESQITMEDEVQEAEIFACDITEKEAYTSVLSDECDQAVTSSEINVNNDLININETNELVETAKTMIETVVEKSIHLVNEQEKVEEEIEKESDLTNVNDLASEAKNVVETAIEKALNTMLNESKEEEDDNDEKEDKKKKKTKSEDDHKKDDSKFKRDDDSDDDDNDDHHFYDNIRMFDHSVSNETVIRQTSQNESDKQSDYNKSTESENKDSIDSSGEVAQFSQVNNLVEICSQILEEQIQTPTSEDVKSISELDEKQTTHELENEKPINNLVNIVQDVINQDNDELSIQTKSEKLVEPSIEQAFSTSVGNLVEIVQEIVEEAKEDSLNEKPVEQFKEESNELIEPTQPFETINNLVEIFEEIKNLEEPLVDSHQIDETLNENETTKQESEDLIAKTLEQIEIDEPTDDLLSLQTSNEKITQDEKTEEQIGNLVKIIDDIIKNNQEVEDLEPKVESKNSIEEVNNENLVEIIQDIIKHEEAPAFEDKSIESKKSVSNLVEIFDEIIRSPQENQTETKSSNEFDIEIINRENITDLVEDDLATIVVKPDELSPKLLDLESDKKISIICDEQSPPPNPLLTSSFMSLNDTLPSKEPQNNQDLLSSFDLCDTLTVESDNDEDRLSNKTLNLETVLNQSNLDKSTTSSTASYYTAATTVNNQSNKNFKSSASVTQTISSSNYMTAVDELSSNRLVKSNSQSSDSFYTVADTSFQSDASRNGKHKTKSSDISMASSVYSCGITASSSFDSNAACSDSDLTPNLTLDSNSGDQTDLDTDLTTFDGDVMDDVKLAGTSTFNVEYFLKNMYPLTNESKESSNKAKTNTSSSHNSTLTDDEIRQEVNSFTMINKDDAPQLTESKLTSVDDTNDFVEIKKEDGESLIKPDSIVLSLTKDSNNESPLMLNSPVFEKPNLNDAINSGSGSGDNVSCTSSVLEFEKLEMQCTIDSMEQEESITNSTLNVLTQDDAYQYSESQNMIIISHDLNTIYESYEKETSSSVDENESLNHPEISKSPEPAMSDQKKISNQNLSLNFMQIDQTNEDLKSMLSQNNDLDKSALFKSSSSLSNSPLASPSSQFVKSMTRMSQTPDRETQSPPMLSKATSRSSSSSSIKSNDSFENELKCKFKIDESSYFARKQLEKKTKIEETKTMKSTKTNDSIDSNVNDSGQCSMNDIQNSQYQIQSSPSSETNFLSSSQISSLTTSYMSDLANQADLIKKELSSDQIDLNQNEARQSKSRTSSSSSSSNSIYDKIIKQQQQSQSTVFNAEDLPSFKKSAHSPDTSFSDLNSIKTTTQIIPSSSSASNLEQKFSQLTSSSNESNTKMIKKSNNSNPNLHSSHHSSNCYCGKQSSSNTTSTESRKTTSDYTLSDLNQSSLSSSSSLQADSSFTSSSSAKTSTNLKK